MLPSITIITPTLNQARFIEQTIVSVLTQNYPRLEYFVIDGGSTDGTIDILKRYENYLTWISEPDKGQVDAINKGIRKSTCEIIAYLNSDDYYEPGALLTVGSFFQTHPKVKILTGKCKNVDVHGIEYRPLVTIYKNIFLLSKAWGFLKICNFISQPSTFWKKELSDSLGLFNPLYHYAMDYDFWLRVARVEKINFVNRYLANFRIYPLSITSSNSKAQFKEEYEIASKFSNLFEIFLHKIHSTLSFLVYSLINRNN